MKLWDETAFRYFWQFASTAFDALDLLADEVFDLADDIVEDFKDVATKG